VALLVRLNTREMAETICLAQSFSSILQAFHENIQQATEAIQLAAIF
jgi:hypothetical protein